MWPMQTSWVGMLQLSGKVLVLRGPQTRALRLCGLCLEIPNNFYRWLSFISQAAGEKRQCWRACSLSPHTFHLPYPLWMGSWLPAPSSLELGPHQESLSPSLPHDHCQLRHYSLSAVTNCVVCWGWERTASHIHPLFPAGASAAVCNMEFRHKGAAVPALDWQHNR